MLEGARLVDERPQEAFHALTRHQRIDLAEFCCPVDSELAEAVLRKGGAVHRLGLWNGYDLSKDSGTAAAAELIKKHLPRYNHFSPPCTPFSSMQNANMKTEEQRRKLSQLRRRGVKVLENVAKFMKLCLSLDLDVSVERPVASSHLRFSEVFADLWTQLYERSVYGCMYGLRDHASGMLMEKHWKFAFSSLEMANHMQRKCSRDHDHVKIEGNCTAPSAGYPRQLCDRFATMVLKVPPAVSLADSTTERARLRERN